ncbi:MAG: general secretion pathway protein GspC [Polyangiaceae bacterium]|nr:general secretion pathway protein GspC [Polyangiaceae bacterium]
MSAFLRRNFWLVTLTLTICLAAAVASAAGHVAGLFLTPDDKLLTAPPLLPKPSNSEASKRETSAEPILERNPFDSVTGPIRKPEEAAPDVEPDYSDPRTAPVCDGVKVGVIIASTDPDWSFASFTPSGATKTVEKRRGQEVAGKKVVFIGWDRVWLRSGNALCQIEQFKSAESVKAVAEVAPVAAPDSPRPKGGAPSIPPDIAKGIQRLSANEFNIDRAVVDKILENQADLMRSARIVPEMGEGGKVTGIKLFGLRPDTLLGTLGMQNGDKLQTINGFEVASPEKALEAYARLRTADHLNVQVNRGGQNMSIDYNIK